MEPEESRAHLLTLAAALHPPCQGWVRHHFLLHLLSSGSSPACVHGSHTPSDALLSTCMYISLNTQKCTQYTHTHTNQPELKLKPSLFPGRPEATMQVISHFPALDLLTSLWCCVLATLGPQDVIPSCLQTPWNPSFFILFSSLLD